MSDRDFVTIRRVYDTAFAEQLVALLEAEGIPAAVPGNTHSRMLGGLAAAAFQVPLQVPREHAERAREILDALEQYDEVDAEDAPPPEAEGPDVDRGDGPYRSGARTEEDTAQPRKKAVAVAAALLLPMVCGVFGAGHFYARSTQRGLILLALGWLCVVLAVGGPRWAGLGIPLVMALDAWGASSVIDGQRKG